MADPPAPQDPALDVAAFAERVLRRPLWPHQLAAAASGKFIAVIAKARRTGGTALAGAMAMHEAFSHRGCKVLVLSATEDAARRVTESINATLARSQLTRGAAVDGFATRIRLTSGARSSRCRRVSARFAATDRVCGS